MENVLFVIFRLYGGGAERVVSNLSLAFSEHYDVKIAVYDNLEKTYNYQGELIRIKLPYSRDPIGNNRLQRLIRLFILIYQLRKIKRKHCIDVAISFAEQANIVNILSRGKSRTIISVRTLLSKELASTPKMRILDIFIKYLYNRAQQIIVPSQLAALDLQKYFGIEPLKLKVIYNYVELGKIDALKTAAIEESFLRELFNRPVLLNVGRITAAKGQWLLLELMNRIKSTHPSWKMVIVGESLTEGNLRTRLFELAKHLNLQIYDHEGRQSPSLDYDVYLLGFQTNPFKFMMNSHLLLFPSVFEGFPNTILEAMQCGLPIVAADCQAGPREILAPGTDPSIHSIKAELTEYGFLCPALAGASIDIPTPSWITEEWLEAIELLMQNQELRDRLVKSGYRRVLDFDKKSTLALWKRSMEGIY